MIDGWYVVLDKQRVTEMKVRKEEILLKLQGRVEVHGSSGWSPVPAYLSRRHIQCSPSGNISSALQEQLLAPCQQGASADEGDGSCAVWNRFSVLAASSNDSLQGRWVDYLELATANMLAVTAMLAAGSALGKYSVRPLLHYSAVGAAVSGWVIFAGLIGRFESSLGSPAALSPFLSLLLLFPGPLAPAAYVLEAGFAMTVVALIALATIHSPPDTMQEMATGLSV